MKQLILLSWVILGLMSFSTAQSIERSVIGATGGYAETGSVSVSATVGEIAVETVSDGNTILTQGFQQPVEGDFTSIRRPEISVNYRVYPNPTAQTLNIELSSTEIMDMEISLVDMQGRSVGLQELIQLSGTAQRQWDISSLSEGTYILRFVEQAGPVIHSVRIQKVH